MKKSLLALAVLGAFASMASAQSSVTIYGQIDVGVAKSNGGTAPNAGAPAGSAWTVQQAHSSRLGFRGNEDLGGGMSAQFLIEHRFRPDSGDYSGSNFWQGSSYVQLTSDSAGSVYLGRTYIPAFSINAKSDPFTLDGVGQVGLKGFANYLPVGAPATGDYRTANTVGYKTPNLGGFTVNAAVALGEGATGRGEGINAEYTAGPLYVGAAYDKIVGGATDRNSLINIGAAYDFKFIRPIVYYARSKTGAGSVNRNKLISVGLTAPLGAGVIKAVYYRLTPTVATTTPTTELVENKAAVGYDYFLSKRTRLYADFSVAKKDTFTNNRAYNLGVRHDF